MTHWLHSIISSPSDSTAAIFFQPRGGLTLPDFQHRLSVKAGAPIM